MHLPAVIQEATTINPMRLTWSQLYAEATQVAAALQDAAARVFSQ